jgi:hypothetical protein
MTDLEFQRMREAAQNGTPVICIQPDDRALTDGKEYKILDLDPIFVTVRNDSGENTAYFGERFVVKGC